MPLMLRTFLVAGVFALTAAVSRGDSEIVIAIRYLQPKGTSHSHLYLYREDGKLLRQLTNDNSGQDVDPIFAPDGETIVLTREKPNDTREFWSIDPSRHEVKEARCRARLVFGSEKLALFHERRRRGSAVVFTNSAAGRVRLAWRGVGKHSARATPECDSAGCCG